MDALKCVAAMDFIKDWKTWRETLKEGIHQARKLGVSDAVIQSMATKVGDFFSQKVCPATKEEELLKQLWDVGTPDDRKVLATLIFKLVQ